VLLSERQPDVCPVVFYYEHGTTACQPNHFSSCPVICPVGFTVDPPESIRPTSAPSAVIPPQMLGRSAPMELAFAFVYVMCMLLCAVLSSDSADVNEDVND